MMIGKDSLIYSSVFSLSTFDYSEKEREIRKSVHGLNRIEKGKIYGGDKTILYEKYKLIEEGDLEKWKGKIGIKKSIDWKTVDVDKLHEY